LLLTQNFVESLSAAALYKVQQKLLGLPNADTPLHHYQLLELSIHQTTSETLIYFNTKNSPEGLEHYFVYALALRA
jgi:hypothetical protein